VEGVSVESFDVVIAGLGPVGALTANLCAQAGFKTLVIERGDEPYTLPRAIHFDAEAMRIFQSVGLADAITPYTRPMGGSVYLGCDHQQIRNFRSRDTRALLGWPGSNLFYQPKLEAILREGLSRYPNLTIRLGHEVTGIAHAEPGAIVDHRAEDGTERRAHGRFVLACDGASSAIRKALGLKLDDLKFEERWLVMDAFVRGPMRWPEGYDVPEEVRDGRCSLMVCDPERPATLIPGAGEHRRWEHMLLPHERDADMVKDEAIHALIDKWVDPADIEIVRAAVYRFHGLVARRWRDRDVFLLGDAAHQTPPFFGQGMCHGLRDAAQLVWKLRLVADGLADEALLDSYQAERDGHVRTIITASIAAGAAVCILDKQAAQARDADFRAQEAARAGKTVAMTDVVPPIREGVLADGAVGIRLPQPPVRHAGQDVRLDDLLAGRFAILSRDPLPALPAAWSVLAGQVFVLGRDIEDVDEALRAWLDDLGARAALIRPDRYLFGAAPSADDLPGLVDQLSAKLRLIAAPAAVETAS
jgi:3-(3-hydroxy-phenyl)propionate hydroxylase